MVCRLNKHLLNEKQNSDKYRPIASRQAKCCSYRKFKAQLCHLRAVWLQMSYVMLLCLSFLIYELEISNSVHSQDCCANTGKTFRSKVSTPCYILLRVSHNSPR